MIASRSAIGRSVCMRSSLHGAVVHVLHAVRVPLHAHRVDAVVGAAPAVRSLSTSTTLSTSS
jgi:hypothetical protein